MKKLILASAIALGLTATAASAADLGNGFSWNTEWTNTYNVSDEVFTSELETGLEYSVTSEVTVYGTLYADVKNTDFTGSEIGVVYEPAQLKALSVSGYVTLDNKFKNEKVFVEAVLKF
jgi:hypothetical protein